MSLTILPPDQEALARRMAELVLATKRPVLNRAEAILHVGLGSDSAFDRWCQRLRVRPCAHGRYARGQLDRAMLREAGQRGTRRKVA